MGPAGIPGSLSQTQSYGSPVLLSPLTGPVGSDRGEVLGGGGWTPSESVRDVHLSGHEPRYYPGMLSRSQQRRDSGRQSSLHESDRGGWQTGGG